MRWMRACWLAVLAAALGCRSAERTHLYVDPALAALVSPEATMVAGARVESLRGTALYKRWVAEKRVPLLDELAARLGLDPRRDLWELMVASEGEHMVALARGKFAPMGREPRFEGARRTAYKGYTLIGDEGASVVFMNSTTAAAGPAAALRAIIDRRGRGRGVSPLIQQARTLPARTQLWLVSSRTGALAQKLPPSGNLAALGKILATLETARVAADLHSGLRLEATGSCRSEQDARTLQDALKGLIGLARLTTPDNAPELLRAWDGVNVRATQRAIEVRAEIPADLLDQLIARFEKRELTPAIPALPGQRRGGL